MDPSNVQMWVKLKSSAFQSLRYGVSDRGTADIAISVLQIMHTYLDSDSSHLIDKNKKKEDKRTVE